MITNSVDFIKAIMLKQNNYEFEMRKFYSNSEDVCIICKDSRKRNRCTSLGRCGHFVCERCTEIFVIERPKCIFQCSINDQSAKEVRLEGGERSVIEMKRRFEDCINESLVYAANIYEKLIETIKKITNEEEFSLFNEYRENDELFEKHLEVYEYKKRIYESNNGDLSGEITFQLTRCH